MCSAMNSLDMTVQAQAGRQPNGTAAEAQAGRQPENQCMAAPPAGDGASKKSVLLAQIPDLDAPRHTVDFAGPADGRIIRQGLSNKLVMGVGLILIMVAVLEFFWPTHAKSKPIVNDLPAWRVPGSAVSGTPGQPASPGAALPTASGQPGSFQARTGTAAGSPAVLTPQSQAGANRPMALSDAVDYRENNRLLEQGLYQADVRSDPASGYRAALPGAAPSDPRNGSQKNYRNDFPGAGNLQGSPLMPSAAAGTSSEQAPPAAEPGVARLDGTIAQPSARNTGPGSVNY